jgi:hypothetical protein
MAQPRFIQELVEFLILSGFTLAEFSENLEFENLIYYYKFGPATAIVERDRNQWLVAFSDPLSGGKKVDPEILRDFLCGIGDPLDIQEQINFVKSHLTQILRILAPERAAETHKELAHLKSERVKRLYPEFPKAT